MIHVASAAHIDAQRLLRHATAIIICVALPCGLAAWAASLLPLPDFVLIVSGVVFSAAYFAAAYAVAPWIRSDMAVSWSFVRRSVRQSGPATLSVQP
jgi:hypothetical protein